MEIKMKNGFLIWFHYVKLQFMRFMLVKRPFLSLGIPFVDGLPLLQHQLTIWPAIWICSIVQSQSGSIQGHPKWFGTGFLKSPSHSWHKSPQEPAERQVDSTLQSWKPEIEYRLQIWIHAYLRPPRQSHFTVLKSCWNFLNLLKPLMMSPADLHLFHIASACLPGLILAQPGGFFGRWSAGSGGYVQLFGANQSVVSEVTHFNFCWWNSHAS